MRHTRISCAITAVMIAAVTAVVTIGTGTAEAWPGINYCTFDFTGTPTVVQPNILGFGTARCTKAPATHFGTLTLEYEEGDHWVVAEFANNADIPAPQVDFRVSTHCYNGTWRMSFHVKGNDSSGDFGYDAHSEYRNVLTCENRPPKEGD
ncbi:hypothetical protein ACFV4K_02720 [Nocardia sp. NPDC059764]|uniref:hypothetical protein n=1 Tax=Nocardia sp. NPDC059764 TaxID=3346939 RepID=UPI00364765F6